jgi:hypothetical protein
VQAQRTDQQGATAMDETTTSRDAFAAVFESLWAGADDAPYASRTRCTDDLLDLHNAAAEPGVRAEILAIVARLAGRSLVTAAEVRGMLAEVAAAAEVEGAFARFVVVSAEPVARDVVDVADVAVVLDEAA